MMFIMLLWRKWFLPGMITALIVGQFVIINPNSVGAATPAKAVSVEGTIRISGAWALYPMMVKWAEEFKKVNPGVRIDVSAGGAGKGIADALGGLVDIGMVSRELRPEEIRQNAFFVPVVKDAVFPTINQNNEAFKELMQKGLKKKALQDMWVSGQSLTWGQLMGTANNQNVRVYTRSDSCGAAETWAKYLGVQQEDLKGVAVYGDPGVAEAVRKDKSGIGYNNLNFAYDLKTGAPIAGIQVVPIDVNENGRIDAAERLRTKQEAIKAVLAGVYPSPPARDLYLVTKESFSGPAKIFVRWILSDGQKFVDEVGYLKISKAQIKDALKKTGN
jgi:phosphate transport system substrate-binding protein